MRLSILFMSLFISSCATAWHPVDVAENERPLRICSPEIDGQEKAFKGFCYRVTWVKKRTLLSDLYRFEELFWPFEDVEAMKKFTNENRVLVPRD